MKQSNVIDRMARGMLALTLAGAMAMTSRAADVEYFGVIKSGVYTQAVDVASVPLETNAFQFITFVIVASNTLVTNATVRIPSGATRQLSTNAPDGLIGLLASGTDAFWLFTEYFNTESAMNSAYPSTSGLLPSLSSRYTVNMSTINDGQHNRELNYYLATVPPIPSITNLPVAQQIDAGADFTIGWASLSGGLIPKIVYFSIMDRSNRMVFSSPVPFETGALDGNSRNITIPANTLPPGQELLGSLVVFQPTLPNTNYAFGVIGHLRSTSFPMATLAPPQPEPIRLAPQPAAPGQPFGMAVQLPTGKTYRLQGSDTLTNWIDLLITNPPTGLIEFSDPDSLVQPRRFYRVISP